MTTTRRPNAGSHANDVEEIRADIAEARSELGDTVQALAAKADVKAQARGAAETAKERVADAAETAKERVADAAETAKAKVAGAAEAAQEKLAETSPRLAGAVDTAKEKAATGAHAVSERAAALADKAQRDPRVRKAVAQVKARPVPVVLVVAALVVGYAVLRRRRSR